MTLLSTSLTGPVPIAQRKLIADGQLSLAADYSWISPSEPARQCRTCGRIAPQSCFRPRPDSRSNHGSMVGFHPDCVICEYLQREADRRERAFEIRATAIIADHMRRERDQGLHGCTTLAQYQLLTGVRVTPFAVDMEREWEHGSCRHCESIGAEALWRNICPDPYVEGGLSRMTADRTDTSRLFGWDNFTWMCIHGNVAKHKTDPATYAIRQAYWRAVNLANSTPA